MGLASIGNSMALHPPLNAFRYLQKHFSEFFSVAKFDGPIESPFCYRLEDNVSKTTNRKISRNLNIILK